MLAMLWLPLLLLFDPDEPLSLLLFDRLDPPPEDEERDFDELDDEEDEPLDPPPEDEERDFDELDDEEDEPLDE